MNQAGRTLRILFLCSVGLAFGACAIVATRPVQEMSDTAAAIRAAREVQADTLSPELFLQASEWFLKARTAYKYKNFKDAKESADRARKYAEQAEFESIRNGGSRADATVDSGPDQPPSNPDEFATPTGTPAEALEEKARLERSRQNAPETAPNPGPTQK